MQQFLIHFTEVPVGASVALLPSPHMVIVRQGESRVILYGPHQRVWQLNERVNTLLFCMPHMLKVLFGHPRYYVNKSFTSDELPLLQAFGETLVSDWRELLDDARASVKVLPDEMQFLKEWPQIISGGYDNKTDTQQRQLERICKRYAGQSPSQITQEIRLAQQLAVDIRHRAYSPSDRYADQSHYIRECRKLTGQTPAHWQNVSATFYIYNGKQVTIET